MFVAGLFIIAKMWKQPQYLNTSGPRRHSMYNMMCVMEYYAVMKKINSCHCGNVDGIGRYYAKGNKPEGEKKY